MMAQLLDGTIGNKMYTEIKNNLIDLPDKIRMKEEELYNIKKKLEEKKLSKKTIRDIMYNSIYITNRSNYQNDKEREKELKVKLSQAEDYKQVSGELINLEEECAKEQRNLDYIKRMFRQAEALARM